LEYAHVTLLGMGKELLFTTLSGGEFYFENLVDTVPETGKRSEACGDPSPYRLSVVPGRYSATVLAGGPKRHFEMLVPVSEAIFVPLGEITVLDSPELQYEF
jgi:hypothetical protein